VKRSLPAFGGGTAPPLIIDRLASIATGVDSIASLRKRRQKIFGCYARGSESFTDLLTQTLKALLLWQKDQAITQTQNSDRCASSQSQILAVLFGNSKLALFTDFGGSQVLES
jgi:hypothetical protein